MKTLKLFFCSVFLVLFVSSTLFAQQELKVNVTIGDDPLEYAYVSINGKMYASADVLGGVSIPKSLLHQGDTITASVVGIRNSTIYRDVTLNRMFLDVKESIPSEGKVFSPRFAERYFREYIKMPDIGQYFTKYLGDFEVICPDKSRVTGKYVKNNILKNDLAYLGQPEVVINTKSVVNTDRITELLGASSATAYESVAALFSRPLIIRYLGEHGRMRRFLVTRINDETGMKNLQILLSVDAFTKDIISTRSTWVSSMGGVHADIEVFYGYNNVFRRIYATDIRGEFLYPLYSMDKVFVKYDVVMENITMEKFVAE